MNNKGIVVSQEQLLEKRNIFWEPQRHQALPYSTTFWDFMTLFGFGRHSMPKRNQVPVTQNWKTRNAFTLLGAAAIFNPTSKTPTKGWSEVQPAAQESQESLPCCRHPLIVLLFIVSRKNHLCTTPCEGGRWAKALASICFWVRVCASGAVMSFQMMSSLLICLGDFAVTPHSTSRKILRHLKLDSGARHTQAGLGAWGFTTRVPQLCLVFHGL